MEVELTGNVASDAGLGVRVRVNPRRLAQPVRDMLPVTPESYIYRSQFTRSGEQMFRTPGSGPMRGVASERAYCDDGVAWDVTTASPVRIKTRFGRE